MQMNDLYDNNDETMIDVKKVVDLAMQAGSVLLKNGAEIFRV